MVCAKMLMIIKETNSLKKKGACVSLKVYACKCSGLCK